MGAVFISDRLFADLREVSNASTYFSNGYTYSGHPIAVAAAQAGLEVIERDGLLAHVRNVGPYLQTRLAELERFDVVREVRGIGLMAAVELCLDADNPDEDRDSAFALVVDQLCQENGLIVRPVYNSCVFSPPLIIAPAQIDAIVDALAGAIETATAQLN